MKIGLMTLRMVGQNYLGSVEASADLQQVEEKRATLAGGKPIEAEAASVKRRRPHLAVVGHEIAGHNEVAARSG